MDDVKDLFVDANILAPMVRVGTLPFRQMALDAGAHLVYGEELVDKGFIRSRRRVRRKGALDIVEYVADSGGKVLFSTTAEHSKRCVFQLGTCSSVTALQAAQHVIDDVVGVDVNMGCPKSFSVDNGMGVALMEKPDCVVDILKTLRANLPASKSVTCKIRVWEDVKRTLDFVRMVEACGITALAIHGRTKEQRDPDAANWTIIKECASAVRSIPVILNGDVFCWDDFQRARLETGVSSVMIARGALGNCDLFRDPTTAAGHRNMETQCRDYIDLCMRYDAHFQNCKYVLQRMVGGITRKPQAQHKDLSAKVTGAKNYDTVLALFPRNQDSAESVAKKARTENESFVISPPCGGLPK